MTAATAFQHSTIWLRERNYAVVALNPHAESFEPELKRALEEGIPATPDAKRRNFYDIELAGSWAYIHVRDESRTVYLVALSSVGQGECDPGRKIPAR
jgi:hypothetical protein